MGELKIVVVDYHKGNLLSVVRGLARAGAAACNIGRSGADPQRRRPGHRAWARSMTRSPLCARAARRRCWNSLLRASAWDFFVFERAATRACLRTRVDDDASEQAGGPRGRWLAYYARLAHHIASRRLPEGAARGLGTVHMTPAGAADPLLAGFCRGRQHVFHPQLRGGRHDADAADVLARAHYTRSFPCIVRHGNVWGLPVPSEILGEGREVLAFRAYRAGLRTIPPSREGAKERVCRDRFPAIGYYREAKSFGSEKRGATASTRRCIRRPVRNNGLFVSRPGCALGARCRSLPPLSKKGPKAT